MHCCRVCYRILHHCGKYVRVYSISLGGWKILSVGICISFLQMQLSCPQGTRCDIFHTKTHSPSCSLSLVVLLRFSLHAFSTFLLLQVSVSLWCSNTNHHRIVFIYLNSFHFNLVLLRGLPIAIVSSKLKSVSKVIN